MKDMTLSVLRDYCKAHSCKTCGREEWVKKTGYMIRICKTCGREYKEFCARRNDQPCFWDIDDGSNEQGAEDRTFNGAINGRGQA